MKVALDWATRTTTSFQTPTSTSQWFMLYTWWCCVSRVTHNPVTEVQAGLVSTSGQKEASVMALTRNAPGVMLPRVWIKKMTEQPTLRVTMVIRIIKPRRHWYHISIYNYLPLLRSCSGLNVSFTQIRKNACSSFSGYFNLLWGSTLN